MRHDGQGKEEWKNRTSSRGEKNNIQVPPKQKEFFPSLPFSFKLASVLYVTNFKSVQFDWLPNTITRQSSKFSYAVKILRGTNKALSLKAQICPENPHTPSFSPPHPSLEVRSTKKIHKGKEKGSNHKFYHQTTGTDVISSSTGQEHCNFSCSHFWVSTDKLMCNEAIPFHNINSCLATPRTIQTNGSIYKSPLL